LALDARATVNLRSHLFFSNSAEAKGGVTATRKTLSIAREALRETLLPNNSKDGAWNARLGPKFREAFRVIDKALAEAAIEQRGKEVLTRVEVPISVKLLNDLQAELKRLSGRGPKEVEPRRP
jgi:hypothetical protein